jgi:hypothetical protein
MPHTHDNTSGSRRKEGGKQQGRRPAGHLDTALDNIRETGGHPHPLPALQTYGTKSVFRAQRQNDPAGWFLPSGQKSMENDPRSCSGSCLDRAADPVDLRLEQNVICSDLKATFDQVH